MGQSTKLVPDKNWTKSSKKMKKCFSCQSFVVNPLFFPLINDRCDSLLRVNSFQMRINSFGLDVSKTIPNLSAILDGSFNGNCLVPK